MASQSRCFPYEKSVVLGGLYDTIEKLGLSLDSTNSVRGTLIVSDAEQTGRMRIALGFGASEDQTQVAPADGCPVHAQSSQSSRSAIVPFAHAASSLDTLSRVPQIVASSFPPLMVAMVTAFPN